MKFSLTVLGSSSAVPTAARNTTAHVLNVHERFYLIDCGEGTQIQIRRNRIRLGKLHALFISHLHSDHILGLFGLLSTLSLLGRKVGIDLYGPPGLETILNAHFNLVPEKLLYPLVFHPLNQDGLMQIRSDKSVEVFSFPVPHRTATWGFLFRERLNGRIQESRLPRSYAFCTDTLFHPPLADHFKGCSLLYHEATYSAQHASRAESTGHSTAAQAAEMARLARAGQLLIGHFSARYKDISPLLNEAQAIYPQTIGAYDGLVIDIVAQLPDK